MKIDQFLNGYFYAMLDINNRQSSATITEISKNESKTFDMRILCLNDVDCIIWPNQGENVT